MLLVDACEQALHESEALTDADVYLASVIFVLVKCVCNIGVFKNTSSRDLALWNAVTHT